MEDDSGHVDLKSILIFPRDVSDIFTVPFLQKRGCHTKLKQTMTTQLPFEV